jgi:hypothetical protein
MLIIFNFNQSKNNSIFQGCSMLTVLALVLISPKKPIMLLMMTFIVFDTQFYLSDLKWTLYH